jgi:hypothetical protein
MEGVSLIQYKNKSILFIDYSICKSKEEIFQLLQQGATEYQKQPKGSVLALINIANVRFDMEILDTFKNSTERTAPYEKKVAVFGIKGLQKVAYNFVSGITNPRMKAFDSELEAKDWLIS